MQPRRQHPLSNTRYPLCLALLLLLVIAVPAVAQEPTPTPGPPVYVVQPGDTLYDIARRFDTTVEAIVAANNLADPGLIRVGQKLIIPTARPELVPSPAPVADSRLHPVRPGETLPSLAFRYGTTVWTLREANRLNRLGLLLPGQELTIPPPIAPTAGTPAFPQIGLSPMPVAQGQTLLLTVSGQGALELNGSLLGQELHFVEEGKRYWALLGVDALTPPGGYPLVLTATEADTGDRLTLHETLTVTVGNFTTYHIVIPPGRSNLLDPKISQAEWARVRAVFAGVSRVRRWQGAFGYPLAGELRVTAAFGQRRSYNGGPVSSYHSGIDYGAAEGTPVFAPMTGTVALAEPLQVRGNAVILDHGWGVFTAFWHLSQIEVVTGQVVGRGEVIGQVGDTGLSTGPHLHWEMRVWGVAVDPLQWTRQLFPWPVVDAAGGRRAIDDE